MAHGAAYKVHKNGWFSLGRTFTLEAHLPSSVASSGQNVRPHNLFYEEGSSSILSFIYSFIDPFLGGVELEIDMTRPLTQANDNVGGKANVINILQQEFINILQQCYKYLTALCATPREKAIVTSRQSELIILTTVYELNIWCFSR